MVLNQGSTELCNNGIIYVIVASQPLVLALYITTNVFVCLFNIYLGLVMIFHGL